MSKVLAPQRGTEKLEEQALEIPVRGKRDSSSGPSVPQDEEEKPRPGTSSHPPHPCRLSTV